MKLKLTEKVLAICEQNYAANCGGCPLRPACVYNVSADINSYTQAVNDLAEQLLIN